MTAGKLFSHQSFIDLFNAIVQNKNRVAVFQDFVMLWSIDLHNGLSKSDTLEKEYDRIVSRYSEKELLVMGKLFSNLVALCDSEPRDILSSLCAELGLVNSKPGNLKSISCCPTAEVSSIADKTEYGGVVAECQEINKPFIMVQEMDCGTGGRILDFANEMVRGGFQLSEKLFVQCVERNRLLGFMCYLQLSLCHIPARVIIGDSCSGSYWNEHYSPAFFMCNWESRLQARGLHIPKQNSSTVDFQSDKFDFTIVH